MILHKSITRLHSYIENNTKNNLSNFFLLSLFGLLYKLLGFIRELFNVLFIADKTHLSTYLKINVVADLLLIFLGLNALQTSILPEILRIRKNRSKGLYKIKLSFRNTSIILALVCLMFSLFYFYTSTITAPSFNPFIIIILLSICTGVSFYEQSGYILAYGKGDFTFPAISIMLGSLINVVLLVPFDIYLGIYGLVLSRLVGLSLSSFLIWSYNNIDIRNDVNLIDQKFDILKNISLPRLFAGSFSIITITFCRLLADKEDILVFYYVNIILSLVINILIQNLSLLILKDSVQERDYRKIFNTTLKVSIALFSVFFLIAEYLPEIYKISNNIFKVDLLQFNALLLKTTRKLLYIYVIHACIILLIQGVVCENTKENTRIGQLIFIGNIIICIITIILRQLHFNSFDYIMYLSASSIYTLFLLFKFYYVKLYS